MLFRSVRWRRQREGRGARACRSAVVVVIRRRGACTAAIGAEEERIKWWRRGSYRVTSKGRRREVDGGLEVCPRPARIFLGFFFPNSELGKERRKKKKERGKRKRGKVANKNQKKN